MVSQQRIAFALAGLGGNNAHGAGFLAAVQEVQRLRNEGRKPTGPGRPVPVERDGKRQRAAENRARRNIPPELEFISCTSGAIRSTATYLAGEDVRADWDHLIDLADRRVTLPRNSWVDPWRAPIISLFRGIPHVFDPWAKAFFLKHLPERLVGFLRPSSPYFLSFPTTPDELYDLWLPARSFVSRTPQEEFERLAAILSDDDGAHGVGVALNSFSPKTGLEHLYVNEAGMELIAEHHDPNADYGTTKGRVVYRPITPQGIHDALWLFFYGFQRDKLETDQHVDGAYARSIILDELTFADRIYAVKPVNNRWIGRLPQNMLEIQDMQTEFWMSSSFREQYRLITTINDLQENEQLVAEPRGESGKRYRKVDVVPVEIPMQRGFFTYFVEDREVFRESYGLSLSLFVDKEEQDVREQQGREGAKAGAVAAKAG